ncbi:universal stress protein UspA-like protein [Mycolicibacterium chubuense NBB4]|uniref:Universal stress protein UspA-like protein n=1 Tax=Mycolicibacterium chubuense (strain NBB4) TaxID=710421 RepID=I4BEY2_MYCCN|nr:universal stress protein [Mycolicibacterium chubuense]AFM15839.1 universal stress protein UspA-like protein [Mycolicibacterium chubuense NBB4]
MKTTQPAGRGVVVGVDASASSAAAIAWAAAEAESRNLPLHVVYVVPPIVVPSTAWPELPFPVNYARYEEDRARRIVVDAAKLAADAVSSDRAAQTSTEVVGGPIVATLVEMSKGAEMMVVGCLGENSVTRALLGSVSSGLTHHAHCPVAVVHAERVPSPTAPVVVGIDGSPASESATAIAFDQASRRGVDLVALHAWSDTGLEFSRRAWAPNEWETIEEREKEVLAERLSGWRERYPDVAVRKVVVCDRPAPQLLEQADTAQLIVVGSRGRGGFASMLLGSVSTAVVQSAQIPVIVARPA